MNRNNRGLLQGGTEVWRCYASLLRAQCGKRRSSVRSESSDADAERNLRL